MKALKWAWMAAKFLGMCAWELLTLSEVKLDDDQCGVDFGGQGR